MCDLKLKELDVLWLVTVQVIWKKLSVKRMFAKCLWYCKSHIYSKISFKVIISKSSIKIMYIFYISN